VLSTFLSSFILGMDLTWFFMLSMFLVLTAMALYNHAAIWPEPTLPTASTSSSSSSSKA
jgi:hypothetical protein